MDEKKLVLKRRSRQQEDLTYSYSRTGTEDYQLQQRKLELSQAIALQKEGNKQAVGEWENKEVAELLYLYGLPEDSPLSVLTVEVFGQVTNIGEHINNIGSKTAELEDSIARNYSQELAQGMHDELQSVIKKGTPPAGPDTDPLNSQLGFHRLLRTSPLAEVPFVCCTDC